MYVELKTVDTLPEFWEHHFQCRYPNSAVTPHNQDWKSLCTGEENLSGRGIEFEAQLKFVSDAVKVFAVAFQNMHRDMCRGQPGLCKKMIPINGVELLKYLRNVSFIGKRSSRG